MVGKQIVGSHAFTMSHFVLQDLVDSIRAQSKPEDPADASGADPAEDVLWIPEQVLPGNFRCQDGLGVQGCV